MGSCERIKLEEGASTFQGKTRGKKENEKLGAFVNGYSRFMCATIFSCHNYYHIKHFHFHPDYNYNYHHYYDSVAHHYHH